MAYNQPNLFDAFSELNIKEEILIKEEMHVPEVVEIFNYVNEELRTINNHDESVVNFMVGLQEAADAMAQPNGLSLTNARAMVAASKGFVKNMKELLKHAKAYEDATRIASDYDLLDETKISSMGWYARMTRQTIAEIEHISAAIRLYRGSRSQCIAALSTRLVPGTNLLAELRTHARARFPNYNNYTIV